LLVFQRPDLPQALPTHSPWLDWLIRPRAVVYAQLAAQQHRRFIKSHTPLDGLPSDPRATYLVSCRHPLDMAVSMYHQGENLNRERMLQLLGRPEPEPDRPDRPSLHEWLLAWIEDDANPRESLDSLAGVMAHLSDAWHRRHHPNVVVVHYDELCSDLEGTMRRLASRLDISVPQDGWPVLVEAATFESMRANASRHAPNTSGILKDPTAFFRRGTTGAGHEVLTKEELRSYHRRVERLALIEFLAWLHREPVGECNPPG
jgi:hypothetical protein